MPLHPEESNIAEHLNEFNRRRSPDHHGVKIISYGVAARIIADTFVPFKSKYPIELSEKGRWTCAARDWRNYLDKLTTNIHLLRKERDTVEEMRNCTTPGYPPEPGRLPKSCRHASACLFCYARRISEYYESLASVVLASAVPMRLTAVRCPADSESVRRLVLRRKFSAAVSTTLPIAGRNRGIVVGVSEAVHSVSPTAERVADDFVVAMKFPVAWCCPGDIRRAISNCITDPTKRFVKYGDARGV